jgi:hypothetical protein
MPSAASLGGHLILVMPLSTVLTYPPTTSSENNSTHQPWSIVEVLLQTVKKIPGISKSRHGQFSFEMLMLFLKCFCTDTQLLSRWYPLGIAVFLKQKIKKASIFMLGNALKPGHSRSNRPSAS